MKPYLIALAALTLNMSINAQEIYQATQTAKSITWPDLEDSYLKTGDFVSISALKSVGAGQSYEQVRLAIGNPHFSEGLGNPDEFNYAFNFYTNAAKTEWVTCQYQVTFNEHHRVDGRYWRDQTCEQYVNEPKSQPVHKISLGADGLFAFAGGTLNDLQPVGREKLNRLAQQIRDGYNLKSIVITGHTDRIGSDAANMVLSQNRADTVKQYLATQGVPANLMTTQGVGSSRPVVTCSGSATQAVIACLQPNRRVEVAIEGSVK